MNRIGFATTLLLVPGFLCTVPCGPFGLSIVMGQQINGIEYRAEVRLIRDQVGMVPATAGAARVQPTVILTNTTEEPRDLWLSGCRLHQAFHRSADGDDVPAWASVELCRWHMTAAPGESVASPVASYSPATVLQHLGEPGEYYFALRVVTSADTITFPVIPVDLSFGADQISYRAEPRLQGSDPAELVVETTITNTGTEHLRIEYGDCAMRLRAYHTPEPIGTPAWDSERSPDSAASGGVGRVCFSYLKIGQLEPGESHLPSEFRMVTPVSRILGDSQPDGPYYFFALVRLNGFTQMVPVGAVTLVAR